MPTQTVENGPLFVSTTEDPADIQLRDLDPVAALGELRLRLHDVNRKVARLEEAQFVSQDLWEAVISL